MTYPSNKGDGAVSVVEFLEKLKTDPDAAIAASNRRRLTPPSGDQTTLNSLPLSPRPPGSPPAAGAFRITTHITTTYVSDLHELIQRITPGQGPGRLSAVFDIQQKLDENGANLPSFWAKLRITGVEGFDGEFVDEGPFSNKKSAKEAVAQKGGEWLKEKVKGWGKQGGKMGNSGKGGVLIQPTKGGESLEIVEGEEEDGLSSGEWVGKLHAYLQKLRLKPPTYTICSTITSTAFSCTLTIPELTGHSVSTNSNPTEFGSTSIFYRKKASAKAAAAREAVLWIWSVDPAARNAALSPSTRYLAPNSSLCSSSEGVVEIRIPAELNDARAPQIVNWLCPKLNLCALEYVFESPAGVPNLVDAWGRVKRVKPGVEVDQLVELGPVKNVFGKPTAKVKIAELCLYWMCRKESARIGVKIIGLKSEYYEDQDEGEEQDGEEVEEEEEEEEEGVGSRVVEGKGAVKRKGKGGKGAAAVGGGVAIEADDGEDGEDDDVMSLA